MNTKNRKLELVFIMILGLLVFIAPLFYSDLYFLSLMIKMALACLITLGLRLIFLTGQLNMGHAAFMGLGAYVSALTSLNLGLPVWMAMLLGGSVSALIAAPIGFVTLRIKGAYFAIVSMGLGEIIRLIYTRWEGLFGGASGVFGIPAPIIPISGAPFSGKIHYYYLIFFLLFLVFLAVRRIETSRLGLLFKAISLNDDLTRSVGVNIMNVKVISFCLGSFIAGIGGAYYAHYLLFISPNDFSFWTSANYILYIVVGGVGNFYGALLGPVFLIGLGDLLISLREYVPLVFGIVLIAIMKFRPGGLTELSAQIWNKISR
ncbi:MAG: branched-chain amino acid ABC transporter permease [Thermodesulfobacteriota bacterium]